MAKKKKTIKEFYGFYLTVKDAQKTVIWVPIDDITKLDEDVIEEHEKKGYTLVLCSPVDTSDIDAMKKELRRQELIKKQEELRKEMEELGMVVPKGTVIRDVTGERIIPATADENKVMPFTTTSSTVETPETADTTVSEVPQKVVELPPQAKQLDQNRVKLPMNPATRKEYSPMEYDAIYEEFKQLAESDRTPEIVMVKKEFGGAFIVYLNHDIPVGGNYKGIPLKKAYMGK